MRLITGLRIYYNMKHKWLSKLGIAHFILGENKRAQLWYEEKIYQRLGQGEDGQIPPKHGCIFQLAPSLQL